MTSAVLDILSARERQVLSLMAQGQSNRAISERLFLTVRTVESHVSSILTRLDIQDEPHVHRRVLAVLAYIAGGIGAQSLRE